jgi:hypothetical protein
MTEVNFVYHVLPQLVSLVMVLILFLKLYPKIDFELEYKKLAICVVALLYGKIVLFTVFSNQMAMKTLIASSLYLYFITMLRYLLNNTKIKAKHEIFYYVAMSVILSASFDPSVNSRFQSLSSIFADILLIFVAFKTNGIKGIKWFISSFIAFIFVHLGVAINSMLDLSSTILYAWAELPAQFLFVVGISKTFGLTFKKDKYNGDKKA